MIKTWDVVLELNPAWLRMADTVPTAQHFHFDGIPQYSNSLIVEAFSWHPI